MFLWVLSKARERQSPPDGDASVYNQGRGVKKYVLQGLATRFEFKGD
jgi:hypothetical protein